MNFKPLTSQQGFTLMELLIAIGLFVISVSFIFQMKQSTLNFSLESEQVVMGTFLARTAITEMELELEEKGFEMIKYENKAASEFRKDSPYHGYLVEKHTEEIPFHFKIPGVPDFLSSIIESLLKDSFKEMRVRVYFPDNKETFLELKLVVAKNEIAQIPSPTL